MKRRKNIYIMHTKITPDIRVSTAGIWYYPEGNWSPYGRFQYETWCFSNNSKQKSFQVIHGSSEEISKYLLMKAIKIHRHIVNNLKRKYNPNDRNNNR